MASQKNKNTNPKAVRVVKESSRAAKGGKEEPWFRTLLAMLAILLAYDIYAIAFGEKLPVHDGLGWDGELYGNIIKNFSGAFSNKQLQQFTIGRTLPLAVIYYSMKFFSIVLTNPNIILQFQILNSLLLLISATLWIKIAKHLKLSKRGAWLGFLGLFISFANLKNPIYAAVSTDTGTFFLGMLMLFLFLKAKPWGILATSILGAFVSPTMLYFGILLFIFKQAPIASEKSNTPIADTSATNIFQKYSHLIVAFFICLIILYGLVYSSYMIDFTLPYDMTAPMDVLVSFSIISLLVLLLASLAQLFNHKNAVNIPKIIKSVDPYKLGIAAVIFLLIQFIIKRVGQPNMEAYQLSFYIKTIMKVAVAKPFLTIVSAMVWYGPLLLVTLVAMKEFKNEIHKYSYGLLFAVIAGLLLLFLDPESRHGAIVYPFICAFTVKAIDRQISKNYLLTFAVLSVVFSKIWFPINPIPADGGNEWEFPMQRNFMNYGPWMANQTYAVQGMVVLCAFLIIFLFIKMVNSIHERKYKTIEQSA